MTTVTETGNHRHDSYARNDHGYNGRSMNYGHAVTRNNYNQGYGMHQGQNNANIALLAHGLQGLSMQDPSFTTQTKNGIMTTAGPQYNGLAINTSMPPALWGSNAQMMFTSGHPYPTTTHSHSPAMYSSMAPQYLANGYAQTHDNSPLSQNWTPSQTTGELPTLITPRRDSVSSNENDAPGTPSYANYPSHHHGGVAIVNRSPGGTFTTSTPSPLQYMTPYGVPIAKVQEADDISPRIHCLISTEPSIPQAIPAPSSPLKPLDRALENLRGETNVYIRGLLPETSDEMLETWGKRFGDIKSSKSIIDHATGLCKGFGFVRYHNYKDAEDCIRGFHHLGYEVSFARESFYSKLKAIADDGNTNLYVSNLPKAMNEHELASIFAPHKVCSARILRDRNGTGRGVGFARFESRTACEEVVKSFNNQTIEINGEDHTIQIRYADTQEQKHLKQTTAAARQFRSAEYEYATQAHKVGWLGGGVRVAYSENGGQSNEFENYLGTSPGIPIHSQRWAQPAWRQLPTRSPLSTVPQTNSSRRNVVSDSPSAGAENQDPRNGETAVKAASLSASENSRGLIDTSDSQSK